MAIFGINYDEGNKDLNYKSVEIHYDSLNKKRIFNSGDFVKDWFDLIKFIITELSNTELHFTGLSSVDHFFMDGADMLYDKAYLISDNNVELIYDEMLTDQIILYVPKGTKPTWTELKEICK